MATLEQRMTWLAQRLRDLATQATERRNRHPKDSTSYHYEDAVVDCYGYAARAIDFELAQADTVAQPEQVVPFSSNAKQGMNPPQLCRKKTLEVALERLLAELNRCTDTSDPESCSQSSSSSALVGNSTTTFDEEGNAPVLSRRYSAGVLTTVYAEALCPSAARDAMLEALADAEEAAALKCVELEWELSGCLVDENLSECLEDEELSECLEDEGEVTL